MLYLFLAVVIFLSALFKCLHFKMGRVKRIWYLSPMRAKKVQASSKSREPFRQKVRSLALLNGWACAVKICHDGMLEDTNSLDASQIIDPISDS